MPMKCCVPHCLSNYSSHSNQGYISVFSFPKNIDDLRTWLANIPRKDWKPSPTSVVCLKHFDEAEVSLYEKYFDENGDEREKRRSRPVLLPGAVPKIFEDLPKCTRKAQSAKRQETEEEAVSNAVISQQRSAFETPTDWSTCTAKLKTTLNPLLAKPSTMLGTSWMRPRLQAPPTAEDTKRFSDLSEAKLQLVNMQTKIHRADSIRKRKFEEGKYKLEMEILRKRLHFEEEKHKLELELLSKELEIKHCILKREQEKSQ